MFFAGFRNRGCALFGTTYMDNCSMWVWECVYVVCILGGELGGREGEYSSFKSSLNKMQNVFSPRIYAEYKRWRVEFLSPLGPQELFVRSFWASLALPSCPHLFPFQSLWKLLVGCWRSRSCHLEVYRTYAGESQFQTLQLYQLELLPTFLGKKKTLLEWRETSRYRKHSRFCVCGVSAWIGFVVLFSECSLTQRTWAASHFLKPSSCFISR